MIIGIGNDIVDISRIDRAIRRHGGRFEKRCFTPAEREKAARRKNHDGDVAIYAKRFAAKEATAKALGTGISKGVSWQDIEIINDADGRPFVHLHGKALETLEALTPAGANTHIHLSLSDEPPLAQAFVIIEAS